MEDRFIVFGGLNSDSVIQSMDSGNETLAIRRLVVFAEENGIRGNVWRAYLCRLLAGDDNVFSRALELGGQCGPSLEQLALADLARALEMTLAVRRSDAADLLSSYEPSAPAEAATRSRRTAPVAAAYDQIGRAHV